MERAELFFLAMNLATFYPILDILGLNCGFTTQQRVDLTWMSSLQEFRFSPWWPGCKILNWLIRDSKTLA